VVVVVAAALMAGEEQTQQAADQEGEPKETGTEHQEHQTKVMREVIA
jgi:hypothetical protein